METQKQTVSIEFSVAELNAILAGLADRPWREANPVIMHIREAAEKAAGKQEKRTAPATK